jgi:hypothetical protein
VESDDTTAKNAKSAKTEPKFTTKTPRARAIDTRQSAIVNVEVFSKAALKK